MLKFSGIMLIKISVFLVSSTTTEKPFNTVEATFLVCPAQNKVPTV